MRLSEYMLIMCPDVTTKTRRRCWMPLELELQVSVWGPNLDALKEQELSLTFERSLQTVYCHYWEVYFDISCCSISGRGNRLCTFAYAVLCPRTPCVLRKGF